MLSFDSPVSTPWHRVPVSWKFLSVCVCSLLLFIFDSIAVQLFAMLACALLYTVGGATFFNTSVQRLKFLWPVLLIIVVWHGFSGTFILGIGIVLRLVTIVALSNLMTMTSRLSDLLALIEWALKPVRALGVNTRPVEIAVALVVRFTPVLIGKGSALADAWRTRSVKRASWRLVFPLSLVAIDDAENVAQALKARGGTLRILNDK